MPRRTRLVRLRPGAVPSWVAAGVVLVGIPVIAWRSGGYFPADHLWLGAVAAAVAAVALAVRADGWRFGRLPAVALGALAVYALVTALSAHGSPDPARGAAAARLDLVYVAVLGLAVVAAGTNRTARLLPWGVLAAGTVVVGGALVARLLPAVLSESTAEQVMGGYRLGYPLTYWNALGLMAAMVVVLGLGLSSDPRARPWLRGLALGAVVLAAPVEYLTFSRGGWLATGVGVVALVLLGVHRRALGVSVLVALGAGAVAILAVTPDALTVDPALGAGQVSAGHRAIPFVLLAVLGAVVARTWSASATSASGWELAPARAPRGFPAVLVRPAAALVAVLVALVIGGLVAEGRPGAGYRAVGSFASTQWREFGGLSTPTERGVRRLTSARGTRSDAYRVALDGFAANPVLGDGAGAFRGRYLRDRRVDQDLQNVHSLYLETLSDTGLVGFVPLAALLGAVGFAVARGRRGGGMPRTQVVAVGATCLVWAVHAGVDWDWQMPAVTVPALVLAASVLAVRDRPDGGRGRRAAA